MFYKDITTQVMEDLEFHSSLATDPSAVEEKLFHEGAINALCSIRRHIEQLSKQEGQTK